MNPNGVAAGFGLPEHEREADDQVFLWRDRGVGMRFGAFHRHSDGGVSATLDVQSVNPLTADPIGSLLLARVNLLGPNHQRDTIRALQERENGLLDWDRAVRHAFRQAYKAFTTPAESVNLRETEDAPLEHLVSYTSARRQSPLLPADELAVFQGDGASLKSTLALMCGIAVATGEHLGPFFPHRRANVLLIDWETRRSTVRRRVRRICQGHGIDEPDFRYLWCEVPLVDCLDHVRREIDRHTIEFVILDSIALAVGGEVKAELVLPFQAAIRRLGEHVTKLVISHISAESAKSSGSGPARAYGSVFVRNFARVTYEVKRTTKEGAGRYVAAMTQEKVNEGPEDEEPLGLRVVFEDPEGPVTVEAVSMDDAPSIATRMKIGDRALRLLKRGALSNADLAGELEATEQVVRNTFARLKANGQAIQIPNPDSNSRHRTLWALPAFQSELRDAGA